MSVSLSDVINRMNNYTPIYNLEETRKVLAIDEAVRTLRRQINPPWTMVKGTLKVFQDVLIYPVASDHNHIAYIDNQSDSGVREKARLRYTSLSEFFENVDSRNDLSEIWDGGVKYLGIRYNAPNNQSVLVDGAESLNGWTSGGDAGTLVLDTVVFKEGNSSIRVPIVSSTGIANVATTVPTISDSNYQRKYKFVLVYLGGIPTSIQMQYGADNANYLYGTVTKQFSGQAFKANDWNLLAFDLNNPTGTVGTPTTTFNYQNLVFTGAPTGTYYIDSSYLRTWSLMDYWYYSKNNVQTALGVYKNYFYNQSGVPTYDITDLLIGDEEWSDVIAYDADLSLLIDSKEQLIFSQIKDKRDEAWLKLLENYPDLQPIMITTSYSFGSDYQEDMLLDFRQSL